MGMCWARGMNGLGMWYACGRHVVGMSDRHVVDMWWQELMMLVTVHVKYGLAILYARGRHAWWARDMRWVYIYMADIVMAYRVMAHIAMAHTVMEHIALARRVMVRPV